MENHRPSLKNVKTKAKGETKNTKGKHTMPCKKCWCNCELCWVWETTISIQCKEIIWKGQDIATRILGHDFLYMCMSFHNTCDLAITVPPQQSDNAEDDDRADDQEDMQEENEDADSDINDESDNDTINNDKEIDNTEDFIWELFQEYLLMTHGPAHHKWESHIIQLVSIQMFVLNVKI